jgi:transposase-like protein
MVLSMALEPISKSAVHYLAKKVSSVKVAKETRYRRCIAVDETKLRVKKSYVYVWSAVDVDSKELLALEESYGRSSLNALSFLKKAFKTVALLNYQTNPLNLCVVWTGR